MATVIYPSPIFGPVHSRRLGISLGINLLPADGKVCTFDCIYCECGYNADHRPHAALPTRSQVAQALEQQLQKMVLENQLPDVLTFAGNGEPTVHPDFLGIIQDTVALRNQYCPQAKVSVLSNATQLGKESVRQALLLVDNNILKLDTIQDDYIQLLDRPTGVYSAQQVIENMRLMQGHLIIQTMFLKGLSPEGKDMNNTTDDFVLPWLQVVKSLHPQQVMIYTIDRETPDQLLEKATHQELDRIVALLHAEGLKASASY